MATIPPRLHAFVNEANALVPNRRRSSDGNYVDKPGDHNQDARGIVHAQDLGQSMPDTPYWEPRFGQFDVFAHCRRIAAEYVAATPAVRMARWRWLYDGGFMVWWEASRGYEAIFNPSVSLSIRQNGDNYGHREHAHFSIGHTVPSENDTQPVFGTAPEEEEDVTDAELEEIVDKVVARLGTLDPKTHEAGGLIPALIKHYIPSITESVAERMLTIDTATNQATGVLPVAIKRYADFYADRVVAKLP